MKKILILSLSLLISNQIFSKESSHNKKDDHSKHESKKLALNNGKKWEIDQVMTENMNAIMEENKKVANLEKEKKATKEDYNKLSNLITTSTETIVTKCKLEPKADEAYHSILADLNIVAEHLKDSKKPKHAIEKLDKTLKAYVLHFNHPDSK